MNVQPSSEIAQTTEAVLVSAIAEAAEREQRARNLAVIALLESWEAEDGEYDNRVGPLLEANLGRNKVQMGEGNVECD